MRTAKTSVAAIKRIQDAAGMSDPVCGIAQIVKNWLPEDVQPPIDLEAVAYQLGVRRIVPDATLKVPGELRRAGPKILDIHLLPNQPKGRRRFTLGHELGHVFFEQPSKRRRPSPSRELENLCNRFAAELLMPRDLFKAAAGGSPDLRTARELASTFDTSLTAALRRVAELYDYRAFELYDGEVSWSYRLNAETRGKLRDELMESLAQDLSGNKTIQLHRGPHYSVWTLEWHAFRSQDQALALLKPR